MSSILEDCWKLKKLYDEFKENTESDIESKERLINLGKHYWGPDWEMSS